MFRLPTNLHQIVPILHGLKATVDGSIRLPQESHFIINGESAPSGSKAPFLHGFSPRDALQFLSNLSSGIASLAHVSSAKNRGGWNLDKLQETTVGHILSKRQDLIGALSKYPVNNQIPQSVQISHPDGWRVAITSDLINGTATIFAGREQCLLSMQTQYLGPYGSFANEENAYDGAIVTGGFIFKGLKEELCDYFDVIEHVQDPKDIALLIAWRLQQLQFKPNKGRRWSFKNDLKHLEPTLASQAELDAIPNTNPEHTPIALARTKVADKQTGISVLATEVLVVQNLEGAIYYYLKIHRPSFEENIFKLKDGELRRMGMDQLWQIESPESNGAWSIGPIISE